MKFLVADETEKHENRHAKTGNVTKTSKTKRFSLMN